MSNLTLIVTYIHPFIVIFINFYVETPSNFHFLSNYFVKINSSTHFLPNAMTE